MGRPQPSTELKDLTHSCVSLAGVSSQHGVKGAMNGSEKSCKNKRNPSEKRQGLNQ